MSRLPWTWPSRLRMILPHAALAAVLAGIMVLPQPVCADGSVVVTPGDSLDAATLEDLVRRSLPGPEGGEWSIRIVQPGLPLFNPAAEPLSITVALDEAKPMEGGRGPERVNGWLRATDARGHGARLRLVAELQVLETIPVPLRPLAAGMVAAPELFGEAAWPRSRLEDDVIRSLDELAGLELARRLPAGRPIRRAALRAARAIHRGEPVRIVFVDRGLQLTVTGHALEDAAVGELGRAINTTTNRQVQGRVVAPGEIVIGGSGP
ncbi:flagellar basal body P-ring formation chaperone FlgA [Geminicoccus roseus]|uniref:flagellar basal body P-ring formation chaperone FlgA n=1 Tax=Geminicoccus roseus TaxID=404900 RepID=UPI0004893243|nr:flagellar basal body P-ring formation chaperone FlgA [Geminicoccus roseus]